MASDPAGSLDPEFPGLSAEVIAGYRDAPATVLAEVIAGTLHTMPRPRPAHQRAGGELHGELRGPFDRGRGGPGGWVLLPEPELRLGDLPDVVIPDVAGWRRERLPEAPAGAIAVVPDWVCEVLSDSTRRHDLTVKVPMYFRHGVGHAWLIDADAQTLQVYRRVTDGWLLVLAASGDDAVRAEPFDAVELDLAALWRW
ncbi:MAG: Uma2 family endonuclease [Deltaproteobacteria bacterium]|nr:Uma2 family endonuclease [Myxococcales bacterium]MDP3217845.1 Uma2 family endonuclease [Deltaproteobacteria bacterium]